MLVFLCVTIFILSVISLPISACVKGHLDLFENDGYIVVSVFGIKVFQAKIHLEGSLDDKGILKYDAKNLHGEVHLNADKKDRRSIARLFNYMPLENLLLKELVLTVRVGKNNDAFFTTILLGAIKLFICSALSYLKSRFDVHIKEDFIPEYNQDKFEADFSGIISISLADIISSYVLSKIHKANRLKEVRQN